jgi:outer membrane lipoprotein-sorting protein
MNRRKVTVVAAAAGVVAGVAGLAVLNMPAGAGPAPVLPEVSAQSLVESVLTAKPAAFGGTVDVNNDLGIPAMTGVAQLSDGASQVRMWTDGDGRVRVSLPAGNSERTFVDDGTTGWLWNSQDKTVTKSPHGDVKPDLDTKDAKPVDPVSLSREVVAAIQESSDLTVDGTARVANRPAYELVLTPKPTERTVLREVRVAVDSELRIPLRVSVLTNGATTPAAQVGFSELNVGPQDADLFTFTPPAGAKVEEAKPEDIKPEDKAAAEKALTEASPQVIGSGWDTVVVAKVPADGLAALQGQGQDRPKRGPKDGARPDSQQFDPQALLKQLGKQISGPWGSGTLISTKVGNILLTDDGRVAAGAVPEQVLVEAIGQVK